MSSEASFKKKQQYHRLLSSCVRNQDQLITDILNAPDLVNTKIDVCSKYMTINFGMFLTQKMIYFRCRIRNKCILDVQGNARHFIALNSSITFQNFIFINGNAYNGNGGSLLFTYSLLTLIRCDVVNNTAYAGGGIYLENSNLFMYGDNNASTPSLFENNVASYFDGYNYDGTGGAICGGNVTTVTGYFLFRNNYASGSGGAFYLTDVNLTNVVFRNNSARMHGGVFYQTRIHSVFKDVVFDRNSADNGAAIYQDSVGTIQLDNVTMLNNTAYGKFTIPSLKGMVFISNARVDARRVSVINTFEDPGVSDVILGSTVFVWTWNAQLNGWQGLDYIPYSFVNLPLSPPTRMQTRRHRELARFEEYEESLKQRSLQRCVFTSKSLQHQVHACDNAVTSGSCIISICARVIRIPNQKSPTNSSNVSGIDLTNKRIKLVCRQTKRRCILDGQGLSRIFYGTNASIIFRNIVFANGYDNDAGGALMMKAGSAVSLWDCSFINNTASFGSAIAIYGTSLIVGGNRTTFISNNGDTPPLYSNSSTLDISDTMFAQNNAAVYGGGGVMLFNSKIDLYNVTFSNRSNNQPEDCSLYYVFDSRFLSNGANCFNVLDPN